MARCSQTTRHQFREQISLRWLVSNTMHVPLLEMRHKWPDCRVDSLESAFHSSYPLPDSCSARSKSLSAHSADGVQPSFPLDRESVPYRVSFVPTDRSAMISN